MQKHITAQLRAPWLNCDRCYSDGVLLVVKSNHPRFVVGSRFDYGFLTIALRDGYSVTLLPKAKP